MIWLILALSLGAGVAYCVPDLYNQLHLSRGYLAVILAINLHTTGSQLMR